ncbi:Uncharacterised protein [Legionella pneumophila]|nr:Uncharacterised protein [Legionella pneumophila]CZG02545.1 Uncharacterised protein [Legionella pneumophila]CZG31048.1 Uncharacterised protein [Legionella pneumophila]CZG31089.1 Uncharacterised protein [Legionella pneumophila]CZG31963.1 Uncharacterised protein [Legionella pneumophila]
MVEIAINTFINAITPKVEDGLSTHTKLMTYESNQLSAEFISGNHGWLSDRYSKNYPGQLRLCY